MTVPAIEPMSAEEREYRGRLTTPPRLMAFKFNALQLLPNGLNPERPWTALECRLMAASNALRRVA